MTWAPPLSQRRLCIRAVCKEQKKEGQHDRQCARIQMMCRDDLDFCPCEEGHNVQKEKRKSSMSLGKGTHLDLDAACRAQVQLCG